MNTSAYSLKEKIMRNILYRSGKLTQSKYGNITSINNYSLTSKDNVGSTAAIIQEKNNNEVRINKYVQTRLNELVSNTLGLQSVLRNDNVSYIDRTLLNEIDDIKILSNNQSETKSSRSETNSLNTKISSNSNDIVKRFDNHHHHDKNNNDNDYGIYSEDLTQKYYKELRNSLKNCILTKKPPVTFNDIAGNRYAKKIINEAFILPSLLPELFKGKPKIWNKILLYGPPGVGKTMLAQAVCNEVNATIFWVSLADVTSKFIGESEKLLRMLFDMAREHSPSIIILDEMDSIVRKRSGTESETERRIKTEFFKQLDGINNGTDRVYILATTNMPWELDIAALRRFDRKVLVPMPDLATREQIFRLYVGGIDSLNDSDYKCLAQLTEGYSGSDITNVINDAFMRPVRMLEYSTHYKLIKNPKNTRIGTLKAENSHYITNNNNNDIEMNENYYYTPCNENDIGAVRKSLAEIPQNLLLLREVSMKDFKESIKNCKPTVHQSFIELYNKFLLKYGHIEQKEDIKKENQDYKTYFL